MTNQKLAKQLLKIAKSLVTSNKDLEIEITVPTNEDYWGDNVTPEQAENAAEYHLEMLLKWAKKEWGGAGVSGRLVSSTIPSNAKTTAYENDDDRDDIVEGIKMRSEKTFMKDFAKVN